MSIIGVTGARKSFECERTFRFVKKFFEIEENISLWFLSYWLVNPLKFVPVLSFLIY